MAGLRGARMVSSIETEQGRRWAESKLKALTGGDRITARFMRQDFFEFTPQFKLRGGRQPQARDPQRRRGDAPAAAPDPVHRDHPAGQARPAAARTSCWPSGTASWPGRSRAAWNGSGSGSGRPRPSTPRPRSTSTAEDALGRWLEECCRRGPNLTETTAALFAAWKSWAEANGEYAGTQRRFSDLMLARGFDKWRDPETDLRGLRGIALRLGSPATTEMEF